MFFDHALWVLGLALVFEYFWGDPRSKWHPVAVFGYFISETEKLLWKNSRFSGVFAWFLLCFSFLSLLLAIWYHLGYGNTWVSILLQSLLLWSSLGWKSLIEHVQAVSNSSDLDHAKKCVGNIVGRNTGNMDAQDVRRAAIESLAENTSDSIIAPLFWFAIFGVFGAWFYRMINTLDAMWGYKNTHYLYFGWWSAKIDDIANFFPARITAFLILIQQPKYISFSIYQQASQHQSPNAGFPETAMAFLLKVRLGGPVQRQKTLEQRPWMGAQNNPILNHHISLSIHITHIAVAIWIIILAIISFYLDL